VTCVLAAASRSRGCFYLLRLCQHGAAAPSPLPSYLLIRQSANDLALEASADACDFANNQASSSPPRVLLLDFGKAYYARHQYGAQTSTKYFHSNAVILSALESAAGQYWTCGSGELKNAIIAYGNTNHGISKNLTNSQIYNAGYYQQNTVLNLADYETRTGYGSLENSAGASDMELAWAGPTPTQQLVAGEQACGAGSGPGGCGHPYFDFGDAHGCPLSGASGSCYGSWTVPQVANLSFSDCCQNLPIPEIYDSGKASQWTVVRSNWDNNHSSSYVFAGTMGIDCSSLTPQQGWDLLSSMNPYVRDELLDFTAAC
jgi:hypothetical protein